MYKGGSRKAETAPLPTPSFFYFDGPEYDSHRFSVSSPGLERKLADSNPWFAMMSYSDIQVNADIQF